MHNLADSLVQGEIISRTLEEELVKKTLVIVDHPHFDTSVITRRWTEELRKFPEEFVVHNLQSSYPRGQIDPALEHSLIENNGTVVFQFPVYWFNCPPLLKQWFDLVLTSDWAFRKGSKLENRKMALAVSCGSGESDYSASGKHGRPIEDYLLPLIHSFEYCHASYAGCFHFLGAANPEIATVENIAANAKAYVEFLRSIAQAD